MRKFLVILCSMALFAGTITPTPINVYAAEENDGDIVENPWGGVFETTTEAPTEAPTEEPTSATEEETTATSTEFAIVTQPVASVDVEPGEVIKFSVVATGTDLSYQWQYTKDGITWKNLSARSATLTLKGITAKYDGYQYRCSVADGNGNKLVSDTATINIVAKTELKILSQPEDVLITGSQTATFTVGVQGSGLTFQWQYYVPSTGEWKKLAGAAARTNTFSMDVTTAFDGYKYRCFIKDCEGNTAVTELAYIYVEEDFAIVTQPKDTGVVAGSAITFEAGFTGTGLAYQWQYSKDGSTWKDLSGTAARGTTYTFTATSAFNNYKYRCVATDYYGNTLTTDYGTVVICDGITINSQPQDVTVSSGDAITLTIDAIGPGLTYQWQYCTKTGSTWKNLSSASAVTDTFTTTVTSSFNGFKYRCVLTDSLGNVVESDYAVVTVE